MPDAPVDPTLDAPVPQSRRHGPRPPRWLWGLAAAVVVVLVAVFVVQRETGGGPATGGLPTDGTAAQLPKGYPFSAESVWRQNISGAPVADNSSEQVAQVAQQAAEHYGGVAAFNVNRFQVAYYTVGPDQDRVDVAWNDCQKKGYTPKGLLGKGGQFSQVPIPADAVPAVGTDGQLTVYSPSSDQLWEFWKATRLDDGSWQACWGGRMDHVSTAQGYFRGGFGSSASGLAVAGGMVWVDDARAGVIDHALSLQLIDTRHWKTFSWPAQRSDGQSTDKDAVQEGTRFRLDPSLDVDSLGLNPVAAMIARAAQTYGFIVTDRAGTVAISAEAGQEVAGETDPWPQLMDGADSWNVMAGFPWKDLQALPRNYGKPAATATSSSSSSATRTSTQ